MEISQEDIEEMKKSGLTYEEIESIIESEKDFETTGKTYSFDEVKKMARKKLFSKTENYV